ncbi:uncharacterized protein JCM6883_006536 [Sporobolomyces salmoneus]|uniref:uncharacterized protein n=1 Tax=Sporobolomyces salmoneus TaxID=183962 RepID=UPI00317887A0
MMRSPSPTRSTRSTSSNLIRSYTTSSDLSASEQLAAIAKAREERSKQREGLFSLEEARTGVINGIAPDNDTHQEEPQKEATKATKTTTNANLPKLRVQPGSERSFTPSVPSTPSDKPIDSTQSDSITPRPASPLRNESKIVEIPPFRPKSTTSTTPSVDSNTARPITNVVLSRGLFDRLKAQRASKSPPSSRSPTPSSHESLQETSNIDLETSDGVTNDSTESDSMKEATKLPLRDKSVISPPEYTLADTVDLPLSSPALSFPESLPPLTTDSTAPSSLKEEEEETDDAVSELSRVFTNRERSKSRSKIYGRYGEEVEYDFTALSDVQERSERSSMSTWQGHLRQNSLPFSDSTTSNRYASSAKSRSIAPSSPIVQSRSTPSLSSRPGDAIVDVRLAATSQLLGRSSSIPDSIFNRGSSIHAPPTPPREVRRTGSPTRNTSPDIAKRASRFESSPAPSPSRAQFPSAPSRDISSPASSSRLPQPPLSLEDPLAEIERRREARRARLESIRNIYQTPRQDAEPPEDPSSERDRWNEIERKEEQEEFAREAVIEGRTVDGYDRVVTTRPSEAETLCEGYLSIPPEQDESPTRPRTWTPRYSVLTSDTLSFRPTDQNSLKQPIVALDLVQCDRVEEEPTSNSFGDSLIRPFSVVFKSGERKEFACEKGSERVRWILALEDAIGASKAQQNLPFDNSRTPIPRSRPQLATRPRSTASSSPTRREASSVDPDEDHVSPAPAPSKLASTFDVAEPQDRSRSIWSRPASPPKPVESTKSTSNGLDDFAIAANRPHIKPLSTDLLSRYDSRPLPTLPPSPARSSPRGHARSQSDLSVYFMPDTEPPFRPFPTRPQSFHIRSKTEDYVAPSPKSSASIRSSSSLTYQEARPLSRVQGRAEFNVAKPREVDAETVTTRRGVDTASEKISWKQTLRDYEREAREVDWSSSSPTTPSRNDLPRSVIPDQPVEKGGAQEPRTPGRSGFRLPLGKKKAPVSVSSPYSAPEHLRSSNRDPFAKSAVVQPSISRRSQPESSSSQSRSDSRHSQEVNGLLWTIRETLENQRSTLKDDKARLEMQAQAISALAHWVTEDTRIRQAQHDALGQAVDSVVQQVASLPQRLLEALENAALPDEEGEADDPVQDEEVPVLEADEQEVEMAAIADGRHGTSRLKKKSSKRGFIINPKSYFATAARSEVANQEPTSNTVKPKGPRMPGVRLWGAPEPVANRSTRWGSAAVVYSTDEQFFEPEVAGDTQVAQLGDALRNELLDNERVGEQMRGLRPAEHAEREEAGLSLAISDILETLRDLSRKQSDQATQAAEDRAKSGALTAEERAELETKRAEIARIEQVTSMNAERTAKINEMVAQLARKTDQTDRVLSEIAKNVKEGRTTTMDPALTAEIKKLLGGVQSGVDAHVSDFRGKLTGEVQRMFKEVGKLRAEKEALQREISELMAFHAKYSGTTPRTRTNVVDRDEAPVPTQDVPAKPKIPSFYGPRALR